MLYSLDKIKKVYGKRTILDIPKLEIEDGKIYTLIGPNGAGKTTLLNLLAFLDTPTQGTISFGSEAVGIDGRSLMRLRRKVVQVDQHPLLFTGPVWKNLDFGLKIRKVDKKERLSRIAKALELVGMEDFYYAASHTLSGGETKRIALARALVVNPEVLLCDEPTANVDSKHQEVILRILERSNREGKLSIIFATHYLAQAQRLAHHTLVLQNGRLSHRARENVYPGDLLSRGQRSCMYRIEKNVQVEIPIEKLGDAPPHLQIFLKPESLSLKHGGQVDNGTKNVIPAVVTKTERENGRIRVCVDAGISLEIFLSPEKYSSDPFWIGEQITVHIPDTAIEIHC